MNRPPWPEFEDPTPLEEALEDAGQIRDVAMRAAIRQALCDRWDLERQARQERLAARSTERRG